MAEARTEPAFTVGRVVSWLIVSLMVVSIIYAITLGILNWRYIGV